MKTNNTHGNENTVNTFESLMEPRLRTLIAPAQMRAEARAAEAELLREIIPVDDTDENENAQAEFALYLNGYGNMTLAEVRARYEAIVEEEFNTWEAELSIVA